MIFYEFFAGGGMARLGLGKRWACSFANDICAKKAVSYNANFRRSNLLVKSIEDLTIRDLPDGVANLAWASFPCQDLSLAGNGAGLDGDRSGTFWAFWNLIRDLQRVNRAPRLIVLENVTGAITSNKGEDFRTLLRALASAGYRFGPLVIDGIHFVPQSRPRLFIVATDVHIPFPQEQRRASPSDLWHSPALRAAHENLSADLKAKWLWLDLPAPPRRQLNLSSLLEPDAKVEWHSRHKTNFLLSIMSEVNLCKVREAQNLGCRVVGTLYKRTRNGVQRAEVRFDEVSGCLRTPGGGSSRQTILVIQGESIRSRLITPREVGRLMGVPDRYKLPENYNEAYHLMGDGLVVPAVRWMGDCLLRPICEHQRQHLSAARHLLRSRVEKPLASRRRPVALHAQG